MKKESIMLYVSRGISKSDLCKPLKVTCCRETWQLTGLQSGLWRKGRYGFGVIQAKSEELALKNLSKTGLAEAQQEDIPLARYYILTSCSL